MRKNFMKRLFILLTVVNYFTFAQTELPAEVTKVATAAANWLKLETGARSIGMGGAQVAAGRGISAIPYNPASLGFITGSESYYSKSYYLADISHNVISYGTQVTATDFIGLHVFYLDSGPISVNTEEEPDGTGELYHVLDISIRGTYSKRLTDRLRVGGTLKYIREQIYTTYMQTFAFDFGSNFNTGIYGFVLGMSVSNFGPEVKFQGEGLDIDDNTASQTDFHPLPLTFRLGVQNDLIGKDSEFFKNETHRLTLAADGVNPIDYTVYGSTGVEYSWRETAFARFGKHVGHDTAGMSFGAGVTLKKGVNAISVDYAYVNYGVLEETHQFGLSFKF
jgi:hypothetical protein